MTIFRFQAVLSVLLYVVLVALFAMNTIPVAKHDPLAAVFASMFVEGLFLAIFAIVVGLACTRSMREFGAIALGLLVIMVGMVFANLFQEAFRSLFMPLWLAKICGSALGFVAVIGGIYLMMYRYLTGKLRQTMDAAAAAQALAPMRATLLKYYAAQIGLVGLAFFVHHLIGPAMPILPVTGAGIAAWVIANTLDVAFARATAQT
jgi:hypothetical protein